MENRRLVSHVALVLVLVMLVGAMAIAVSTPPARADHNTTPVLDLGTLLPNSATLAASNPCLLTDSKGDVYTFYVQYNTGLGVANIHVVKSVPTPPFGVPEPTFDHQVNSVANVADISSSLSAAVDHSGNIYVAWVRESTGGPSYRDIYVSKSADGGNTWGSAILAGPPNDGTQDFYPVIASAPNGNIYVAWITYHPATNWFYNIEFSMSTDGGLTFSGYKNISGQGPGGLAAFPSIAVDAQGRAYVAYTGLPATVNTTIAYTVNVTWSEDGSAWSAPTSITGPTSLSLYPTVATDSHGRVHLAWIDYRSITATGAITFWYAHSDDRGATWSLPVPITTGTVSAASPGTLVSEGDNLFLAYPGEPRSGGIRQEGIGYTESPDRGTTWYPEQYHGFVGNTFDNASWVGAAVDRNGTVFLGAEVSNSAGAYKDNLAFMLYNSPPSPPSGVSATTSGASATVTWTAPPEGDVAGYQILRSTDGTNYQVIGSVSVGTTSFTDASLANGTYWYEVKAMDTAGTFSHPPAPASAQIGPSLQDQINALQRELNSANANLATIQSQLTNLQNQLNNLKSTDQGNFTQLQNQINNLQSKLNDLQSQQATQTISYANLAFEVIVVVLLVVLLLNQMRKPKSPQMMMAQPAHVEPKKPEDEL